MVITNIFCRSPRVGYNRVWLYIHFPIAWTIRKIILFFFRYQKNAKAAEDVEYPAYGVTGNGRETSPTSADRKLAQNAQLYHYQHQKQQMIAFDA